MYYFVPHLFVESRLPKSNETNIFGQTRRSFEVCCIILLAYPAFFASQCITTFSWQNAGGASRKRRKDFPSAGSSALGFWIPHQRCLMLSSLGQAFSASRRNHRKWTSQRNNKTDSPKWNVSKMLRKSPNVRVLSSVSPCHHCYNATVFRLC